ncbi:siderophore-interacting protein [Streptosporangium sp. NPDC023615]|uniref:siderophore-interacting protein n=1 Tax=Streptosporangium sp. NPDC023615 TaxID=3154794 RepID=UPI00342D7492
MNVDRAVPGRRPSRNPLERVFAKHIAKGTVTRTSLVTPTMKSIRIHCPELNERPHEPGQHVRVEINDPLSLYGILRPIETLRTYTIWEHSPASEEFELRAHLYEGDGIGLKWARDVKAGDPVKFWGPMGDFTTQPAPYHLFVGEETATVAFGPMIRALGPDAQVFAVLESETEEDEVPLPGEPNASHRIHRVHRNGASAVSSERMLAGMAKLELPGNAGTAYVAGEARTCRLVRDHLVREHNWPRQSIKIKPFWTPDKRGLHH